MNKTQAADSKARINAYARNIRKIAKQASDTEKANGATWYSDAYRTIAEIAETFNVSTMLAVAVAAVLSPNNNWERNIADLAKTLYAWRKGILTKAARKFDAAEGSLKPRGYKGAFMPLRLSTYPINALKAFRILSTGETSALSGRKVSAFFDNIFHQQSELVTVDCHAYSIANATRYTSKTCPNITARRYREISAAYERVAIEYGLDTKQLQAITWLTWRRLHGLA
jgi:hypothetical protein